MATITDPARQLADICERLSTGAQQTGDDYLASVFGVEPWSKDFWEIISYIMELSQEVREIVTELPLDEDIKNAALVHIGQLARAFSKEGLVNTWQHATRYFISPEFINPIKILSGQVRSVKSYPKFSDEEVEEIIDLVTTLLGWLRDHQLSEQDFIRQSLIIGLENFVVKLSKFSILGWGCAVESLKQVVSAYILLERGFPNGSDNSTAQAMIQKIGSVLKTVGEKVSGAKDIYESGEWILKLAGALEIGKLASSVATGLISSG